MSELIFRFEDFRYFMLDPESRTVEHRNRVGEKLVDFARALAKTPALSAVRERFYPGTTEDDFVNPGEFRAEAFSYWVSFGPKASRPQCHFTIRIAEDGLAVEAFSPFKDWTRAFVKKAERKREDLVESLRTVRKTTDPYHFRLREAYYCDPTSSYKGECIRERVDYLKVHPSILDAANVGTFILEPTTARLDERTFRPEIFFVRHFALSDVLDSKTALDIVADAIEPVIPYFSFAFEV